MSINDAGSRTDLAVSLPTETSTFSAAQLLPVGRVDSRHLLLLADDVASAEVEALALSLNRDAGWVGASRLQLMPGAELHGPWEVDAQTASLMELPEWVSQVMLLECEPQRRGALPPELTGLDPIADAFPLAQPAGTELRALTALRSIARRLAGGLRLVGDAVPGTRRATTRPVIVVPDPEAVPDLQVFGPVWMMPEGLLALVGSVMPGARLPEERVHSEGPTGIAGIPDDQLERLVEVIGAETLDWAWRKAEEQRRQSVQADRRAREAGESIVEAREGYGVVAPVDPHDPEAGLIEVRVGATEAMCIAVASQPWAANGAISYDIVWVPRDRTVVYAEYPDAPARRARARAASLIEAVATVLAPAVEGVVVDRDSFLVELG